MSSWLGFANLGAEMIGRRHAAHFQERAADKAYDRQVALKQWDERLANTAYQRAVADMRAAGLNPVLAATKGVPPAGGAPSSSVSPGASAGGGSAVDFAGASAKSASASASKSQDLLFQQQILESGERAYSARKAGDLAGAQADQTKVITASEILRQPQISEKDKSEIARNLGSAAASQSSARQAETVIKLNDQELMARLAEYEKLRKAGDVHATQAGSFLAWLRAVTEAAGFHSSASTRIGR